MAIKDADAGTIDTRRYVLRLRDRWYELRERSQSSADGCQVGALSLVPKHTTLEPHETLRRDSSATD